MLTSPSSSTGLLAAKFAGLSLPLQVLRSGAGYYIGTQNEEGRYPVNLLSTFPLSLRQNMRSNRAHGHSVNRLKERYSWLLKV